MLRHRNNALIGLAAAQMAVSGCDGVSSEDSSAEALAAEHPACPANKTAAMGLMTSLPLSYPLGASVSDIAGGVAVAPWQADVLATCNTVVPLDSLAPVQAIGPGLQASNPLDGIDYLAVIQPRGLSPSDNVALDDWVQAGGHLLLALDPMLTGEYDLPLGDPRRPNAVALIPPVAARWGMEVAFDEAQSLEVRQVEIGDDEIPVQLAGDISVTHNRCVRAEAYPVQKCAIGKGSVTLIADAAVFEDQQLAGRNGQAIHALLTFAFDR